MNTILQQLHDAFFFELDYTLYYGSFFLYLPMGVWLFNKVDRPFQIILLLLIYTGLHELLSRWLPRYGISLSYQFSHITIYLEFYLYLFIYYFLNPSVTWKYTLIVIGILFTLLGVLNTNYLQPLTDFNTHTLMLQAVLLTGLSLYLFSQMLKTPLQIQLMSDGAFWFNCSILLYYPLMVLIWGFHGLEVYRLHNPPIFMYPLLRYLSTLLYGMFLFSAVLNYRKTFPVKKAHDF